MPKSEAFLTDCMEYMRNIPDKTFDLAVVDPPYGRGEDGGKRRAGFVRQKNGGKIFVQDGQYPKRNWDAKPPDNEYFTELFRVSRNQVIWGVNYFAYNFIGGRIIWDKCNDGTDQSDAEIAYCSLNTRVDLFRYMWRGMFQGKSETQGTIQQGNKRLNEKRIHPTQKPVALYRWIFAKYAKQGDRILDTHLGSGSSRIAAYDAGLDFVGTEIDEYYFKMQEERFEAFSAQMSLF